MSRRAPSSHAALSDHLASIETDPAIAMTFECAINANDRGREVLERSYQGRTVEGLRGDVQRLVSAADDLVLGAPKTLRPLVSARVAEYVKQATEGIPALPAPDAVLRYGSTFWTIEVAKRAACP